MFGIGMPELVIILVIALIVLGPNKLPDLARSLGKGLAEFKKASDEFQQNMREEARKTDDKDQAAPAQQVSSPPPSQTLDTVTKSDETPVSAADKKDQHPHA